jgi:hypothetical protein
VIIDSMMSPFISIGSEYIELLPSERNGIAEIQADGTQYGQSIYSATFVPPEFDDIFSQAYLNPEKKYTVEVTISELVVSIGAPKAGSASITRIGGEPRIVRIEDI